MRRTLERWASDFAHAARNLLRAPGFTALAVATLALAIGANTAIFSVVDAVLLHALPFPEADRLVAIRGTAPGTELPDEFGLGAEFYVQYQENATALSDIGLYNLAQTTIRTPEHVDRLFIAPASPGLFSTLRMTPLLGRLPTVDDAEGEVAVLSYSLWTSWFGQDPQVIGRPVEIGSNEMTILGVMRPDFRFPDERVMAWVHDLPTEPIRPGRFGQDFVARLAPGADYATLSAELSTLASRLPERFGGSPAYARIIGQFRPVVRPLEDELVGDFKEPLWILLGTVAIVLLIACANVANLLLVRAEGRQRDLAVRRALGAGRAGLIRAQMAEALVLAVLGAAGGLLLAWVGVPLLVRAAPQGIPNLDAVGLSPAALLFTAGVAALAACASGLLPALRASSPDIMVGLRSWRRTGAGRNHLTRNTLVVLQTAAALVLLVASGLLLQSFRALTHVNPGFDTDDVFTFQAAPDARAQGLSDAATYAQFHYDFMDRLRALPGVESVGAVNTLPLDEGAGTTRFATPASDGTEETQPLLHYTAAGGDYFQTMGIPLLEGSYFEPNASFTDDIEIIVSRDAADILWPGEDAIGQLLKVGAGDSTFAWMSVGGVVGDVMLDDFRQAAPDPMVYLPMIGQEGRSWTVGTPAYVVKTPRAASIAPDIRALIDEVSPSAPMYRVFTLAGLAARSMAQLTFTMLTLAVAALLALALGAVGIYGTLSYAVSQRTREIGIRMALGAESGQVRRMVVVQGSRVALVGVALGVVAALLLTHVLSSLLFGVRAIDPVTFVAMTVIMLGVAVMASYNPARRASSVDPMRAVQAE